MGNQVGYMGPHCRADGHTIGIAIYSDENCDEYLDSINTISQYTGLDLDDGYMKAYYTDSCISCLAEDGFSLEQQDDDSVISGICGELYDESAKCNRYMGNEAEGSYQSYAQEDQEDAICDFIESLMTKSYNEKGEIVIDPESWLSYFPTPSTVSEMTQVQKLALAGSILLVAFLVLYSCYLHRSISQRKIIWNPRMAGASNAGKGMGHLASTRMSRMQSGILQNRSLSTESRGMMT
eukprot:CAMPEP_0198112120 /NCGR_PEP_ID=MMETSP1442-20131203/4023_1 /TAXON_ID= /ORGANISM="Craspedostauros australis, Strain CCMP3328" /LENGTH=236 /DNA_ID=CAMNT_0043768793 /DNA_START=59 /DNA_END=769 /DNA_ORIENTATION=+